MVTPPSRWRPNEQIVCTLLLSLGPPRDGSEYLAKFVGMRARLGIPESFTIIDWTLVYNGYRRAMALAGATEEDTLAMLQEFVRKGKAVPLFDVLPTDDEEKKV